MKHLLIVFAFFATLLSLLCRKRKPVFSVEVESTIKLSQLPSGSGILIKGDTAYIISDDAPVLFKLDLNNKQWKTWNIPGLENNIARIAKSEKNDFEAAAEIRIDNKNYIVAFGSGSLQPYRDSLLVIEEDHEENMVKIPLKAVYDRIKQHGDINIEGAVTDEKNLYLMNRADNSIWQWSITDFIHFIRTEGKIANTDGLINYPVHLPTENGVSAGLSGGCKLDRDNILFCASLENTKNWVDDGTIDGSYIGVYNLRTNQVTFNLRLINSEGNIIKDKLESIDLAGEGKSGHLKAIAIADNDDGQTTMHFLNIKWK